MYYINSTKCSINEYDTVKHGKQYEITFRVVDENGARVQKHFRGFKTKSEAKRYHERFLIEQCAASTNIPSPPRRSEKHTTEEAVADYLSSVLIDNKESTIIDKKCALVKSFLPCCSLYVEDITSDQIEKWQNSMLAAGKNPRTVNKSRSHVNGFLKWCSEQYGIDNVSAKAKRIKKKAPPHIVQIWEEAEFIQFLSVVDNPMYRNIFLLAFYTGRRKNEILALRREDIVKDKIRWDKSVSRKTLSGGKKITPNKAYKAQVLPASPKATKELRELQSPFAFGGESPLSDSTLEKAFYRYMNKANVKKIRFHDLRHSFVSMCLHKGANYAVIADLIGDTQEQVIKTYSHLYPADMDSIIQAI